MTTDNYDSLWNYGPTSIKMIFIKEADKAIPIDAPYDELTTEIENEWREFVDNNLEMFRDFPKGLPEAKFRIWIPYSNTMMQPESIRNLHASRISGMTIGEQKQWIYLQFTMKRDKSKREIYDGDIVKTINFYNEKVFVGIVTWGDCGWVIQNPYSRYTPGLSSTDFGDNIEVIGNMYQNKTNLKHTLKAIDIHVD